MNIHNSMIIAVHLSDISMLGLVLSAPGELFLRSFEIMNRHVNRTHAETTALTNTKHDTRNNGDNITGHQRPGSIEPVTLNSGSHSSHF